MDNLQAAVRGSGPRGVVVLTDDLLQSNYDHNFPQHARHISGQLVVPALPDDDAFFGSYRSRDVERTIRQTRAAFGGGNIGEATATARAPSLLLLLWFAAVALSLFLKRRSVRPGGWLYRYNKEQSRLASLKRRRRIRDLLKDEVLVADLERNLIISMGGKELAWAELQRLRDKYLNDEAEDNLGDGWDDDSSLNGRREYPALAYMNRGIIAFVLFSLCPASFFSPFNVVAFDLPILDIELEANALTWAILGLIVHFVDNRMLINGYGAKRNARDRGKSTNNIAKAREKEQDCNELSEPLLDKHGGHDEGAVVVAVPIVL